ncbi:unnamed protein product [Polarella glacialis]|uniref:CYTH domain-containing protein n=2 Tax=Polarella glacialis TaxID=89957 RepID=A0A813LIG0_POLGL|nr:unnamed protein product [Polarella glacialis]
MQEGRRVVSLSKIEIQHLKAELSSPNSGPGVPDWLLEGRGSDRQSESGDCIKAVGKSDGSWEVYYDNEQMALTLRGWWLVEKGDRWLLRMPVFDADGPCSLRLVKYDDVSGLEEILERLGLVQHAEAMRNGKSKSMEMLLAQAGVVPFARLDSKLEIWHLHKGGSLFSDEARLQERRDLRVTLSQTSFDVTYAESAAIAELIFERGTGARAALRAYSAEFFLRVPEEEPGSDSGDGLGVNCPESLQLETELDSSLSDFGLHGTDVSSEPCPVLLAYLAIFRPMHMQALQRSGVITALESLRSTTE